MDRRYGSLTRGEPSLILERGTLSVILEKRAPSLHPRETRAILRRRHASILRKHVLSLHSQERSPPGSIKKRGALSPIPERGASSHSLKRDSAVPPCPTDPEDGCVPPRPGGTAPYLPARPTPRMGVSLRAREDATPPPPSPEGWHPLRPREMTAVPPALEGDAPSVPRGRGRRSLRAKEKAPSSPRSPSEEIGAAVPAQEDGIGAPEPPSKAADSSPAGPDGVPRPVPLPLAGRVLVRIPSLDRLIASGLSPPASESAGASRSGSLPSIGAGATGPVPSRRRAPRPSFSVVPARP